MLSHIATLDETETERKESAGTEPKRTKDRERERGREKIIHGTERERMDGRIQRKRMCVCVHVSVWNLLRNIL